MKNDFLAELKDQINLVELVGRYAKLKKSGRNFVCCSPLREERTPSFCVSPDKNFWYDFGIAEGGDAISFLQKVENCDFREAVEMLADTHGITIPDNFALRSQENKDLGAQLIEIHQLANEFFVEQLKHTPSALKYLADRGLTTKTIDQWGLGYGGDDRTALAKKLLSQGFSAQLIAQSGVAFGRNFGDKTIQDRFYQRLTIPLRDSRDSSIVGFSARNLDMQKDTAKYINSPESVIYHKSSLLFGLDAAKEAIHKQGNIIIVEGNFDVIAAHQHGYKNTVATCGTALSAGHIRLIKRLATKVILIFDNDKAGKLALLRAVVALLEENIAPHVADLGSSKDLDECCQSDANIAQQAITQAVPALEYLLEKLANKLLNDSLEGEQKLLDNFFPLLKASQKPLEHDEYLERMSKLLKRPKSIIEAEFARYKKTQHSPLTKTNTAVSPAHFTLSEQLVGLCVAYRDILQTSWQEDWLTELTEIPQKIMRKYLHNAKDLSVAEQDQLHSWELWAENLYGDEPQKKILLKDITAIHRRITLLKIQHGRLNESKSLRNQLIPEASIKATSKSTATHDKQD